MANSVGFVADKHDLNHRFSGSGFGFGMAAGGEGDLARPGWIGGLSQWLHGALAGRNQRLMVRNLNRLSRMSPHLLDDIGLLPAGEPSPLASVRNEIRKADQALAASAMAK